MILQFLIANSKFLIESGDSTKKDLSIPCGGVIVIGDVARWQVEDVEIVELANERGGNGAVLRLIHSDLSFANFLCSLSVHLHLNRLRQINA